MEKDYGLLRPFDLEAAKRGEPICFKDDGQLATFLGESDQVKNDICLRWEETISIVIAGKCAMLDRMLIRMAPLCWVEGKPVYKGDVLFNQTGATVRRVLSRALGGDEVLCDDGLSDPISALTWTQPKGKREGWVNVYKDSNQAYRHDTKEKADNAARMSNGIIDQNRIACVRIEWEE